MSPPDRLPRELESALIDFQVREQWDKLAEKERTAAVAWVRASAPELTNRTRVVAQRISAGISIEPSELARQAHWHERRRLRLNDRAARPPAPRALVKPLLTNQADALGMSALPLRLWAAGLLPQSQAFPEDGRGDRAVSMVATRDTPAVVLSEMSFRSPEARPETLAQSLGFDERAVAAALALQRPRNFGFLVVTLQRFGYVALDNGGLWISQYPLAGISGVEVRRRWTGVRLSITAVSHGIEVWKLASMDDAYRVALRLRFVQSLQNESRTGVLAALRHDIDLAVLEGIMSPVGGDQAREALASLTRN